MQWECSNLKRGKSPGVNAKCGGVCRSSGKEELERAAVRC